MEKSQDITLYVKDFSLCPGPRYAEQGNGDSGEDFYHNILNREFSSCVQTLSKLTVNLDGVDGYMSSFLDEAFGNLVFDFGLELVNKYLDIISYEEPEWIEMIKKTTYPDWAKRREKDQFPKKTVPHEDWLYFDGTNIVKRNLNRNDNI